MSARMRNHIESLKPLRLFVLANEPTSKRLEAFLGIQSAAAKGWKLQENRPVNDNPILFHHPSLTLRFLSSLRTAPDSHAGSALGSVSFSPLSWMLPPWMRRRTSPPDSV
jgi:hypothetical protein